MVCRAGDGRRFVSRRARAIPWAVTAGVVVLRPEPGNARTAARAAALGLEVRRLPLFETRPLGWEPPDPAGFDALLLTSAAALRHAGRGLDALRGLPVVAVGAATAHAARTAGLSVAAEGDAGVDAALALAQEAGFARLLHLAGRERMPDRPGVRALPAYGSDPLPVPPGALQRFSGWTALLHSARAAGRFAELADRDGVRALVSVAAISPAALAAAGPGWADAAAAPTPDDDALLRVAAAIIDGR